MSIEPVKIPQNVHIEDRIVGPLTLRQIIIVGIGCGFSYAMWAMISKSYGIVAIPLTVLVWIPGALSIVFAFVKFNDLSMLQLCLLFFERMQKPQIRTWAPRRGITVNIRTFTSSAPAAPDTVNRSMPADRFDTLSTVLDRADAKPDEDEPEMEEPTQDIVVPSEPAPVRPVMRERVTASPLDASATVDGVHKGTVSLMNRISPPTA